MTKRKRHLEPGWCWAADVHGEPRVWGIVGHGQDVQGIVDAYEGEHVDLTSALVSEVWVRSTPVRDTASCGCEAEGAAHAHLTRADGPGPGAYALTWVEVMP